VIVLDTNVLSESTRSQPVAAVFAWVAAQPRAAPYTTGVTRRDSVRHRPVTRGVPAHGARRGGRGDVHPRIRGRVLPFDEEAAVHYAEILAARRREGRPIEAFDPQIAATARVDGAELATRDVADFAGCGLTLVNPWIAITANSNLESDHQLLSGCREDLLRKVNGAWKVGRRTIVLDANILLDKNLSLFL
jgi:predicted nucleic acid-binding protein